ncbi:MAG TPA: DinB family protein, partial [Bryobacteraceae bacterium]
TIGANSLGFQLKHIAGSVDRITSYLMEQPLTDAQMAFLRQESSGSEDIADLLALVGANLSQSEDRLRQLDPNSIYEARSVGRRALPTTVIGLLVHLAEHTQRHLGQAITLSRLARQPG